MILNIQNTILNIQNMILGKYAGGKSEREYFERTANIEIGRGR